MSRSGNDPYGEKQAFNVLNSQKTNGLPSVIECIRKQSLQNISQFVSQLFDSCDDLFYDLSNNANSNQEQGLYFDSMREIRLKRQALQRDYLAQFNASFQKIVSPQQVAASPSAINKLAVVKNDEIEVDVALTNMITRTNNAYSEEIYDLQTRFDYLLKEIGTAKENNPLLPESLCRLFVDACKAHLPIRIRPLIILLKQFERFVLERMGQIYDEANQLLINAGICPKVARKVNKENNRGTDSRQGAGRNENISESLGVRQNRYNIPLSKRYDTHDNQFSMKAFTQLFTTARSSNSTPTGFKTYSNNPGPLISLSQLVLLLNQAQALVEQDDQYDVEKPHLHDVTGKLLSAQSPKEPGAVGGSEDSTINLVAMLFEFILDDNTIALKLRNQISRLQIPVLKLALEDETFFSDLSHPARSLINIVAAVGVTYNDDRDLSKDKVYQAIVDTVKTICHQRGFDNQIFAELFPQLEKVIEKEQCRSVTVEKRTAQIEIGKSKVKAANKTARMFLVKKLHKVHLPRAAREFLIDSWLNVMIMTLLKYSEQSKEWAMIARTVDDLIGYCQHNKDAEALKQLQPKLLKRISVGLELLGKQSDATKEELEKIKRFIKHSVVEANSNDERKAIVISEAAGTVTDLKKISDNAKSAIARQQKASSNVDHDRLKRVNSMKLGDWIKYEDIKTGKIVRCKLLTEIKPTDSFLFVNHFGVKILEKSRRDIAYDIQQGRITVIDNAPFFERTLAKVFARLKQTTPKT